MEAVLTGLLGLLTLVLSAVVYAGKLFTHRLIGRGKDDQGLVGDAITAIGNNTISIRELREEQRGTNRLLRELLDETRSSHGKATTRPD